MRAKDLLTWLMSAGGGSVLGHIRKESQTGPRYDITTRFWLRIDLITNVYFFDICAIYKRTFVGWVL